jgi:A/G-specific adenine glycosylase
LTAGAETSDPQQVEKRVGRIRRKLLNWYAESARDLPWRRTRDPYAILVSEIMLQQTQVDRVLPYYERFLAQFPTLQELAAGPTSQVIRLWAGLGYNRRAVNLQRAALAVCENYGGTFPRDVAELRKLPGVGAYTAGAIAAFAFEDDVAFLDTNMRRVVERLEFGPLSHSDRGVIVAAEGLLPRGQSWTWNQALIEFGALQCTARKPACVVCPLQQECAAFPTIQSELAAKQRQPRRASAAFETTSRYFRGRVVDALRTLPSSDQQGIDLAELGTRVRDDFKTEDMPWLLDLVRGLQRDGLARVHEESPAYDEGQSHSAGEIRVRLP